MYARRGPRIFHIYGLIRSFLFTFEKGIFAPISHISNLSLRERDRETERKLPRPPANNNPSFLSRCILCAQYCAKPQIYFTVLNSHNNPRKRYNPCVTDEEMEDQRAEASRSKPRSLELVGQGCKPGFPGRTSFHGHVHRVPPPGKPFALWSRELPPVAPAHCGSGWGIQGPAFAGDLQLETWQAGRWVCTHGQIWLLPGHGVRKWQGLAPSECPVLALSTRWGCLWKLGKGQWLWSLG